MKIFNHAHENWPECSSDIDALTGMRNTGTEIRNISLVTSRSVTTTEIFSIILLQTRLSQEILGTTKKPQTIC